MRVLENKNNWQVNETDVPAIMMILLSWLFDDE